MLPGPRERETLQTRELLRADRLAGTDERPEPPRLHLDEYDTPAIVTDEVYLSVARPRVARDDADPGLLERTRGRDLTEVAEDSPRISHERRSDATFGRD